MLCVPAPSEQSLKQMFSVSQCVCENMFSLVFILFSRSASNSNLNSLLDFNVILILTLFLIVTLAITIDFEIYYHCLSCPSHLG